MNSLTTSLNYEIKINWQFYKKYLIWFSSIFQLAMRVHGTDEPAHRAQTEQRNTHLDLSYVGEYSCNFIFSIEVENECRGYGGLFCYVFNNVII